MNILAWLVVGLIAGLIAKSAVPGDDLGELLIALAIGVVGAIAGGLFALFLGLGDGLAGMELATVVLSAAGAGGALWAYRTVADRRNAGLGREGVEIREP